MESIYWTLLEYIPDGSLPSFEKALSLINPSPSSQHIRIIRKHTTKRLHIVLLLDKYSLSNLIFDETFFNLSLEISGLIYDCQTMEEKESPWFNEQRYLFVRTMMRFVATNEMMVKTLVACANRRAQMTGERLPL